MKDHIHKYELKIGIDEETDEPYNWLGEQHIYAECECGSELDREEIELRLNVPCPYWEK